VVSGLSPDGAATDHPCVTTYLIELYVPRSSSVPVGGSALDLHTILVPSDEIAYCLVEASSAGAAADLAATLGLEPERIVEAVAQKPRGHACEGRSHEHQN
jgi:hypothetical protein